jgi:hypothetical protein
MTDLPAQLRSTGGIRDAARFWERLRIWYSGILAAIVLAWIVFSWPHFHRDLGPLFLWLVVFLAIANFCYCAGYAAEIFVQALLPRSFWRRVRWVLWTAGMLLSILAENYWIADEIYPYPGQGPKAANLVGGGIDRMTGHFASNLNFPAPIAVVGFLAAAGGLFVAAAAILIFWFARKLKFARRTAIVIGGGGAIYLALLVGFSASSRNQTLALGQEKYFCEIDCHLAYAVVDVKTNADATSLDYVVTLRTRFDETTISPSRPKDAPLTPSPREVHMIDELGREYVPVATSGTSLMTPLKPAESYTTELKFRVPGDVRGLRLLVNTTPAWADHLVIGDENSWLHKKTYFAL